MANMYENIQYHKNERVFLIGMILSAFFWGCICDTYGRRKIVIIGYLINTLCYIISASAQNFTMLLIAKFFSGFV